MRIIAFTLAVTMAIIPIASADSYLCIAENAARVQHTIDTVLPPSSGTTDFRIVVRNEGLFQFGEDLVWLPVCTFRDDGSPISCKAESPYWGGYFSMNENNVFTLVRLTAGANESGEQTMMLTNYAGSCSRI